MKKVLIFYALLVVAIVLFWLSRGSNLFNFGSSSSATAKIGNKTYKVQVAKTQKERMQGLSGKDSLAKDSGMLFVFDKKDRFGFWMNGMKFPIDIIYIDDNKIVDIVENAPIPQEGQNAATLPIYMPSAPANYVLEVNASEVLANKIKKGDKVELKGIK